jgi:uncharacterized protein (UPF0147 family)
MKPDITTIKIDKKTKQRLDNLKEYERESYEEVLRKILYILNTIRRDSEIANNVLRNIDRNIKRKQRYNKGKDVRKKVNIDKSNTK